jgi:N-acetyl-anhydromuramyl-L-alanine amidase AmpD
MPDENGAIWMPNNNFFPNRDGCKPSYIVLHGTAGGTSAQGIASYFASTQGTANPVSAHYIVGPDGVVVQCVNESDGAWANGFVSGASGTSGDGYGNGFHDSWWDSSINPNLLTISIEHVKSATDNSNQLTAAQHQASFTLILHICQRHNIPMRRADAHGGITGHYAIDPVNRALCPGAYPWDALFAFLSQNGGEQVLAINQVSGFFTEVVPDQRWHCMQTNIDIAYGILNYYRTCTQVGLNGLSQYGLPLASEEGVPNTKQAVLQRFERGVILYDPANEVDRVPGLSGACYPAHIDKGPGQDPHISQLQGQIVQLQGQVAQLQAQIAALQKQEATQLPKEWYDALLPLKPLVDTLS